MVAEAKQVVTIPECNPNPSQEYRLNFKILVLLLQGFCYYVLILTRTPTLAQEKAILIVTVKNDMGTQLQD
jgi:hypothetical protein